MTPRTLADRLEAISSALMDTREEAADLTRERDSLVRELARCGWNLTQIAAVAGVSRPYISRLINDPPPSRFRR